MQHPRPSKIALRSPTTGFTLIEMLAVIMIIGVMMALAFPVFSAIRKRAMRSTAMYQAQQAAHAWNAYLLENRRWPSQADMDNQPLNEPIRMTRRVCETLNRRNTYLELDAEQREHGYLDPWGVLNLRRSENFESNFIHVQLDDTYNGSVSYRDQTVRANVITWSVGPDGISGTAEDVTGWRRPRRN